MVVSFASFKSAALVVVIVMTPAELVVTLATYLVEPDVSQPHSPPAGKVDPTRLCTVSVILVRHEDPAKMASETLARTV